MKTPGHVAYDAYCSHTGCKSLVSGADLPKWQDIKPEIKAAWEAAASAVVGFVLKVETPAPVKHIRD